MENEPRKASDILLDLENKVSALLKAIQSQNFTISLLSNKLNSIIAKLDNKLVSDAVPATEVPQFKVEAGNTYPSQNMLINPEDTLPLEESPNTNGFRRTSRPETYAGNAGMSQPFIQVPIKNDVIVPKPPTDLVELKQEPLIQSRKTGGPNAVSVSQRIVDRSGKSVFLANVEIIDLATNNSVDKTKTNGAGKWSSSLVPGEYRVFVRKREALTKEKVEIIQEISVDGIKSNLELKMMIIK